MVHLICATTCMAIHTPTTPAIYKRLVNFIGPWSYNTLWMNSKYMYVLYTIQLHPTLELYSYTSYTALITTVHFQPTYVDAMYVYEYIVIDVIRVLMTYTVHYYLHEFMVEVVKLHITLWPE